MVQYTKLLIAGQYSYIQKVNFKSEGLCVATLWKIIIKNQDTLSILVEQSKLLY